MGGSTVFYVIVIVGPFRIYPPIFFSGTIVTFSRWIISGLDSGWAYKMFS